MSQTPKPPYVPADLSEQEREELEAAEKGYDAAASGLPDRDEAESPAKSDRAPVRRPGGEHPLRDAEAHGLIPRPGDSGPPLDLPAFSAERPVDLDPDKR